MNAKTNRPKYNRCDSCGRNAHKVAVRNKSGEVKGYCPKCWNGFVELAFNPVPADDSFWRLMQTAKLEKLASYTVVYDQRGSSR